MPCNESRRAFLKRGGCGVFTLAALGLSADLMLPVSAIAGAGAGGERSYPIPATDGVNIDRKAQVILVRYANRAYAFALACPHEHAVVKWLKKDNRFQCSKHDSQYTPDGKYTSGKATRNLDRFPIRKEGSMLIVMMDRVFQSDANAAAWNDAAVDL
jgi:Rieske Fe-S protein